MHQSSKRYKSIKKRSKRTILSISAFEVNIDVDPSNCEHNRKNSYKHDRLTKAYILYGDYGVLRYYESKRRGIMDACENVNNC